MESLARAHSCLSLRVPPVAGFLLSQACCPKEASVVCTPNLYPREASTYESQLWGPCALLVTLHLYIVSSGMGLVPSTPNSVICAPGTTAQPLLELQKAG
ncbi:hypothetical protein I79_009224 [Cricetulus griseus]|uniref:Uncharacterized protein n=1 Tax=Cricetulus griseus TaxID=10029 RepID=G3HF69_CRIGR|nr:hypothetical protein I79_009224 [Cricetulus griseus]